MCIYKISRLPVKINLYSNYLHSRLELGKCLKTVAQNFPNEILEKLIMAQLTLDNGELSNTVLLHRVDMLCTLATLEVFTAVVGPQVLRLVTESSNLEQCSTGIQGVRLVRHQLIVSFWLSIHVIRIK